jgi:hypothetical protein
MPHDLGSDAVHWALEDNATHSARVRALLVLLREGARTAGLVRVPGAAPPAADATGPRFAGDAVTHLGAEVALRAPRADDDHSTLAASWSDLSSGQFAAVACVAGIQLLGRAGNTDNHASAPAAAYGLPSVRQFAVWRMNALAARLLSIDGVAAVLRDPDAPVPQEAAAIAAETLEIIARRKASVSRKMEVSFGLLDFGDLKVSHTADHEDGAIAFRRTLAAVKSRHADGEILFPHKLDKRAESAGLTVSLLLDQGRHADWSAEAAFDVVSKRLVDSANPALPHCNARFERVGEDVVPADAATAALVAGRLSGDGSSHGPTSFRSIYPDSMAGHRLVAWAGGTDDAALGTVEDETKDKARKYRRLLLECAAVAIRNFIKLAKERKMVEEDEEKGGEFPAKLNLDEVFGKIRPQSDFRRSTLAALPNQFLLACLVARLKFSTSERRTADSTARRRKPVSNNNVLYDDDTVAKLLASTLLNPITSALVAIRLIRMYLDALGDESGEKAATGFSETVNAIALERFNEKSFTNDEFLYSMGREKENFWAGMETQSFSGIYQFMSDLLKEAKEASSSLSISSQPSEWWDTTIAITNYGKNSDLSYANTDKSKGKFGAVMKTLKRKIVKLENGDKDPSFELYPDSVDSEIGYMVKKLAPISKNIKEAETGAHLGNLAMDIKNLDTTLAGTVRRMVQDYEKKTAAGARDAPPKLASPRAAPNEEKERDRSSTGFSFPSLGSETTASSATASVKASGSSTPAFPSKVDDALGKPIVPAPAASFFAVVGKDVEPTLTRNVFAGYTTDNTDNYDNPLAMVLNKKQTLQQPPPVSGSSLSAAGPPPPVAAVSGRRKPSLSILGAALDVDDSASGSSVAAGDEEDGADEEEVDDDGILSPNDGNTIQADNPPARTPLKSALKSRNTVPTTNNSGRGSTNASKSKSGPNWSVHDGKDSDEEEDEYGTNSNRNGGAPAVAGSSAPAPVAEQAQRLHGAAAR